MADIPIPEIKVPKAGQTVWNLFWELGSHREDRKRLSPQLIRSHLELSEVPIEHWQLHALQELDRHFVHALAAQVEKNEDRRKARDEARGGLRTRGF